jgi:hypothetical protein
MKVGKIQRPAEIVKKKTSKKVAAIVVLNENET